MNYYHDNIIHLIFLFTNKHDVLQAFVQSDVLRLMIGLKSVYVDTIYIVFKVSLRRLIDYP